MKKDIADRLVAALESGKYKHTRGGLREGDCYCALGVLCELYREETGDGRWFLDESGDYCFLCGKDSYSVLGSAPPSEVRWWAELKSETGFLPMGREFVSIATENDRATDYSLAIDYIKKHWSEI